MGDNKKANTKSFGCFVVAVAVVLLLSGAFGSEAAGAVLTTLRIIIAIVAVCIIALFIWLHKY